MYGRGLTGKTICHDIPSVTGLSSPQSIRRLCPDFCCRFPPDGVEKCWQ